MRTEERHSPVEVIVFGLALLLTVCIAYYGFMRWRAAGLGSAMQSASGTAAPSLSSEGQDDGLTERGVPSVPPLKVLPSKKRPVRKTAAPPPPR